MTPHWPVLDTCRTRTNTQRRINVSAHLRASPGTAGPASELR